MYSRLRAQSVLALSIAFVSVVSAASSSAHVGPSPTVASEELPASGCLPFEPRDVSSSNALDFPTSSTPEIPPSSPPFPIASSAASPDPSDSVSNTAPASDSTSETDSSVTQTSETDFGPIWTNTDLTGIPYEPTAVGQPAFASGPTGSAASAAVESSGASDFNALSHKSVILVSVFASVAVNALLLAVGFACVTVRRRRGARTRRRSADAASGACAVGVRAERRMFELEDELRALKALVAQRQGPARPAPAPAFNPEKDAEAAKDRLPVYLD